MTPLGDGHTEPDVRVLLLGFEPLVREALAVAVDAVPGLCAVADGEAFDVQVMSSVPGGTAVLARLSSPDAQGTGTVLVGSDGDDDLLLDALAAGATGFVTTAASVADLTEAVRAVSRGESSVPARMLGSIVSGLARRRRTMDRVDRLLGLLTPREREVLRLLATGATNAQVAEALSISSQTAKTHVQKVMKKLGVHSRLQAVVLATDGGLLERDGAVAST